MLLFYDYECENITVTFNQDANAQQKERTLISLKYLKTTLD
jgi:hypothetical protein